MAADGDPFGPASDAWEALLPKIACPTVFLAPWWVSAWHQVFGPPVAGRDPFTVLLVEDGGELVGVVPLMSEGDRLVLVGDPDLFDYQDLIVTEGREAEVATALLAYLSDWDSGGRAWTALELPSVPADSATADALVEAADGGGFRVEITEAAVAPVAELPGTWDEFLGSLSKKHRHELRRKIRKIEAAGTVLQVTVGDPSALDPTALRADVEDFFRLMSATGEAKTAFLTPDRRRFFHLLAERAADRDVLRLSFLELDGERVAACMVFDYAGVYLLYNSGYDPARSDLSVGLINKAFAIREAIESGRRRFDFLKGAERYKYDLGGRDRPIHRIVVTRSR